MDGWGSNGGQTTNLERRSGAGRLVALDLLFTSEPRVCLGL